jgi:DHA1 family bicyclomycin/chloramphenicol resistance-like MFS transporter
VVRTTLSSRVRLRRSLVASLTPLRAEVDIGGERQETGNAPNPASQLAAKGPAVRAPSFGALALITGIGPLALDTYLAALPAMQRSLHSSAAVAQLTVTAYIIGLALGQLLAGPLSDGAGRRPYLLAGTVAFTVVSAACAVAPNGPVLVVLRLVQGTVAGAGVACGRAVVSDYYRGDAAATRFGTLASINLIGPVLAPVVGSVILAMGSWRTVFFVLVGVGSLMVLAVAAGIPETLPPADRHPGGVRATGPRMADLLRDWMFMRHVVIGCLATAGFFTYIGGSSFVLQEVYRISETGYAAVFAVNALAMVVASVVFRLSVVRSGAARLRAIGLSLACTGAVGLLVVALAGPGTIHSIVPAWVLLSCVTAGMGLIIPATTTLSQAAGIRSRGTAAALQGGGSMLVGALATPLTGLFRYDTLIPMAALMSAGMIASATMLIASRSRRHSGSGAAGQQRERPDSDRHQHPDEGLLDPAGSVSGRR